MQRSSPSIGTLAASLAKARESLNGFFNGMAGGSGGGAKAGPPGAFGT